MVDGSITENSKLRAVNGQLLLKRFPGGETDYRDHADVRFQVDGWTVDLKHQVDVAMDVPVDRVLEFTVGGPLVAALWARVSLAQARSYFEPMAARE